MCFVFFSLLCNDNTSFAMAMLWLSRCGWYTTKAYRADQKSSKCQSIKNSSACRPIGQQTIKNSICCHVLFIFLLHSCPSASYFLQIQTFTRHLLFFLLRASQTTQRHEGTPWPNALHIFMQTLIAHVNLGPQNEQTNRTQHRDHEIKKKETDDKRQAEK